MITVILSQRGQRDQEVILAGVPRQGETIRVSNGTVGSSLIVEHVLWMEGTVRDPEPSVIVVVRDYVEGPPI